MSSLSSSSNNNNNNSSGGVFGVGPSFYDVSSASSTSTVETSPFHVSSDGVSGVAETLLPSSYFDPVSSQPSVFDQQVAAENWVEARPGEQLIDSFVVRQDVIEQAAADGGLPHQSVVSHGVVDPGVVDHGVVDHGVVDHGVVNQGVVEPSVSAIEQSVEQQSALRSQVEELTRSKEELERQLLIQAASVKQYDVYCQSLVRNWSLMS
jgi:hypothetical protein